MICSEARQVDSDCRCLKWFDRTTKVLTMLVSFSHTSQIANLVPSHAHGGIFAEFVGDFHGTDCTGQDSDREA